jgi:hypothetical protein
MFGFVSFAVTAKIAHAVQAGVLVTLSSCADVFALALAFAKQATPRFEKKKYKSRPPNTWIELLGGESLAAVIRHSGLPVKVGLRVHL